VTANRVLDFLELLKEISQCFLLGGIEGSTLCRQRVSDAT
jgi:hypothetical protein